jgi:hypothetical protein
MLVMMLHSLTITKQVDAVLEELDVVCSNTPQAATASGRTAAAAGEGRVSIAAHACDCESAGLVPDDVEMEDAASPETPSASTGCTADVRCVHTADDRFVSLRGMPYVTSMKMSTPSISFALSSVLLIHGEPHLLNPATATPMNLQVLGMLSSVMEA